MSSLLLNLSKGGFPLPRNFYLRTRVKFTCVNKTKAMYERLRVNVIVYRGSTFKVTHDLFTYTASIIFTYFLLPIDAYKTTGARTFSSPLSLSSVLIYEGHPLFAIPCAENSHVTMYQLLRRRALITKNMSRKRNSSILNGRGQLF